MKSLIAGDVLVDGIVVDELNAALKGIKKDLAFAIVVPASGVNVSRDADVLAAAPAVVAFDWEHAGIAIQEGQKEVQRHVRSSPVKIIEEKRLVVKIAIEPVPLGASGSLEDVRKPVVNRPGLPSERWTVKQPHVQFRPAGRLSEEGNGSKAPIVLDVLSGVLHSYLLQRGARDNLVADSSEVGAFSLRRGSAPAPWALHAGLLLAAIANTRISRLSSKLDVRGREEAERQRTSLRGVKLHVDLEVLRSRIALLALENDVAHERLGFARS